MPSSNCVIKFPQKGRFGRKGYKEEDFKKKLLDFFVQDFKIYDDRLLQVKNFTNPFEPDLTLIDEGDNKNIFIDIEIDEPYEGLNSIGTRKCTHFQQSDISRNNLFKNRGWIVIRFAEIQIHQNPLGCCLFIANVIKSINPNYIIPNQLYNTQQLKPVKQWTKEQANQWSIEKYREKYLELGVNGFGSYEIPIAVGTIADTDLGKEVEEKVKDDEQNDIVYNKKNNISKPDVIFAAIQASKFLTFSYEGKRKIVMPLTILQDKVKAHCYIRNLELEFSLEKIQNVEIKQTPFTLEAKGIELGLEVIKNAVNIAIENGKFIRIQYTRSGWNEPSELSIRTISNVDYVQNVLTDNELITYNLNNQNYVYIRAYCHKRSEERTFRFDRISEIAILDI